MAHSGGCHLWPVDNSKVCPQSDSLATNFNQSSHLPRVPFSKNIFPHGRGSLTNPGYSPGCRSRHFGPVFLKSTLRVALGCPLPAKLGAVIWKEILFFLLHDGGKDRLGISPGCYTYFHDAKRDQSQPIHLHRRVSLLQRITRSVLQSNPGCHRRADWGLCHSMPSHVDTHPRGQQKTSREFRIPSLK